MHVCVCVRTTLVIEPLSRIGKSFHQLILSYVKYIILCRRLNLRTISAINSFNVSPIHGGSSGCCILLSGVVQIAYCISVVKWHYQSSCWNLILQSFYLILFSKKRNVIVNKCLNSFMSLFWSTYSLLLFF